MTQEMTLRMEAINMVGGVVRYKESVFVTYLNHHISSRLNFSGIIFQEGKKVELFYKLLFLYKLL